MNHIGILKRSWAILWSYKTLWIFGILLALTSGGGPRSNPQTNWTYDRSDLHNLPVTPEVQRELDELAKALTVIGKTTNWEAVIAVVITVICLLFLLGILFAILRYVSQVALIRMVDEYERSGQKVSWRQGFRLGWSRGALRLFLINLLVFLVMFTLVVLLFGCAALPVLIGLAGGQEPLVVGIVGTVGLGFLAILLLIVLGIGLSLFMEMIRRVCVLRDLGVFESISTGFHFVRRNFMDVFLLWLILIGIRIGLFILMIPVFLLVLGIALLAGGGFGVALYFALAAAGNTLAAIITAAVVGMLVFIGTMTVPLTFLGGLSETYFSTTWTLAYRELDLLGAISSGSIDQLEPGESPSSPEESEPAGEEPDSA